MERQKKNVTLQALEARGTSLIGLRRRLRAEMRYLTWAKELPPPLSGESGFHQRPIDHGRRARAFGPLFIMQIIYIKHWAID